VAYIEGLADAAGHADRHSPLRNYCTGLLLPGERKSVEPMAARLAPDNVRRMHQSLHHLVADAPWSDEEMLAQVRRQVLPVMQKDGAVVAWIIDDTGFPKQGKYSVGCVMKQAKACKLYRRWEQASRSRLQELASNYPELLRSKGAVVNVRGKGVRKGRQVSAEKMSESKPSDDASSSS
jgi:DDE superfamily endonuclease